MTPLSRLRRLPSALVGRWDSANARRGSGQTGIKASGWYGYFDHVNAAGAEGDFARHLGALEEA